MNTIILDVSGKNINNFIYKLHKNKINIYMIKYLSCDEIIIEILYKDYDLVFKNKTIYNISIIKYKGFNEIKNRIKIYKYLLISIFVGIIIFTILTNIIFDVEVLYNNSSIRNAIIQELNKYGIKKYGFVKSFSEVEDIKRKILADNKNCLEWLEIERIGTKYIIKLEPRKLENIIEDNKIYNIVSKSDAIILSVEAYSGEIIKNVNNYVKKGDVIISSNISLNDEVKSVVSAKGRVYGEVWYQLEITYPLNYYEEKETGKYGEYFNIRLLEKDYNFSKFKNKIQEDKILLKSDLLPIYFSKQKQREIKIINNQLNYEDGIIKAKEEGRRKIESYLNEKEYIIDEKSLKIDVKDSKIVIDMFYSVFKDITEYEEIEG